MKGCQDSWSDFNPKFPKHKRGTTWVTQEKPVKIAGQSSTPNFPNTNGVLKCYIAMFSVNKLRTASRIRLQLLGREILQESLKAVRNYTAWLSHLKLCEVH